MAGFLPISFSQGYQELDYNVAMVHFLALINILSQTF